MRHHYAHQHTHYGSPNGEEGEKGGERIFFPKFDEKIRIYTSKKLKQISENSRRDTPRRIKVSKDPETILKAIREEGTLLASVSLIALTADFYMQQTVLQKRRSKNGKVRKSKIYPSTKS